MERLKLKIIPSLELPLWNVIFGVNGELGFGIGEEKVELLFTPIAELYQPELAVRLTCENHSFWLCFRARDGFLQEQVSKAFSGDRVYELPNEVRLAVFEVIFEQLQQQFDSWSGRSVELEEVSKEPPAQGYGIHLPFHVRGGRSYPEARGHFCFDEKSFQWFSRLFGKIPATVPGYCAHIPLAGSLEVGKTSIPVGELKQIEKLDLIKLDEYYPQAGKIVLHIYPHIRFVCSIKESQIVVEGREESKVTNEDEAQDLNGIEIELRFEVGEKRIPLGDLSNLKAGYTFDLEAPLERPVTIRANGRRIGFGELVQINEHIGVRVLEIFRNATD